MSNAKNLSVFFYNNGTLDKRAFTMLGLSAKSDDNKIGFFGTGFKYAIATLLREGAKISVVVREGTLTDDLGDEHNVYTMYKFYTETGKFRNKEFDFIYCEHDGVRTELPFTTHLGANWKLWQAYRELFTNALDEGGGVKVLNTHNKTDFTHAMYTVLGDVVISVSDCPELIDVYNKHDMFFIPASVETIAKSDHMRAVEKIEGSANSVYYKTMYTGTQVDKPSFFTYDFISRIGLTEDRTIADAWYIKHYVAEIWCEGMSYDTLIECLPQIAKDGVFENHLSYEYHDIVSDDFKRACEHLVKQQMPLPMWARDLYIKTRPFEERITDYKPTRYQQSQIVKALKVLDYHGAVIDPTTIVTCVSLPADVLGYYRNGKLYIAKECFERGFLTLLGTIYEEHLHHTKDVADMSRAMQNILVDKTANLMIQVYDMDTMTEAVEIVDEDDGQ